MLPSTLKKLKAEKMNEIQAIFDLLLYFFFLSLYWHLAIICTFVQICWLDRFSDFYSNQKFSKYVDPILSVQRSLIINLSLIHILDFKEDCSYFFNKIYFLDEKMWLFLSKKYYLVCCHMYNQVFLLHLIRHFLTLIMTKWMLFLCVPVLKYAQLELQLPGIDNCL